MNTQTLSRPAPITGAMLYDYIRCPHRIVMDRHGPADCREPPSEFVQLLWSCGVEHEAEIVAKLSNALSLRDVPLAEREQATRDAMARRVPLIHGGRLSHTSGLLGEPDLLRWSGTGYIPGDIKAANAEGEPDSGQLVGGYVVQVGHYVNLLERCGLGNGTRDAFIVGRDGKEVLYPLDQPRSPRCSQSWWEYYLQTLAALQERLQAPSRSLPALAAACKMCEWKTACKEVVKARDDCTLVAELGRTKRDTMLAEIPTVAALANCNLDQYQNGDKTIFPGIGIATLQRFQDRARLLTTPGARPYLRKPVSFPRMTNEVFFDIEADPMRGLVYLHGFVQRPYGGGQTDFRPVLCQGITAAQEEAGFAAAWRYLAARAADSVIFYYSKYERTAYRALCAKYPSVCSRDDVDELFSLPTVIDLYGDVVKPHTEWPTYSQSIKEIAVYLGFKWRDPNPSGAASIEWFHQWVQSGNAAIAQRIMDYNEDDCLATGVVVDGVRALRLLPMS